MIPRPKELIGKQGGLCPASAWQKGLSFCLFWWVSARASWELLHTFFQLQPPPLEIESTSSTNPALMLSPLECAWPSRDREHLKETFPSGLELAVSQTQNFGLGRTSLQPHWLVHTGLFQGPLSCRSSYSASRDGPNRNWDLPISPGRNSPCRLWLDLASSVSGLMWVK